MRRGVIAVVLALTLNALVVPASAQQANDALDEWRQSMAEWTAARDRQEQQYAQDRALWEQQLEDANRPLSKKAKVLIGLGYVGDKMLTGFIDYHASRAAIRSEMGRFDQRFDSLALRVGNGVLGTGLGQQLSDSTSTLLAGQAAIRQDHADSNETIVGGFESLNNGLIDSRDSISSSVTDAQDALLSGQGALLSGQDALLSGQDALLSGQDALGSRFPMPTLRPCLFTTPFGLTQIPEPCLP